MITQYPNWLQAAERLYWVHPPCQYGWPVTRKKNREMLQDLETPEAERIIERRPGWHPLTHSVLDSIDVEREKKAAAMQKTIDDMKSAKSEEAHAAKNYKMNWQSHGS